MSNVVWAMACFVGGLAVVSFGDLVSEEVRGWLDLLPRGILRLAANRLEPDIREAIYEDEWLPELIYALRGAESRPITRVIKGTYFALGLFIAARRVEAVSSIVRAGRISGMMDDAALATTKSFGSPAGVRFLSVPEVATILRVSKLTVYRLVHSGELESIRVGASFRVPEGAVNQYIRAAFYPMV